MKLLNYHIKNILYLSREETSNYSIYKLDNMLFDAVCNISEIYELIGDWENAIELLEQFILISIKI